MVCAWLVKLSVHRMLFQVMIDRFLGQDINGILEVRYDQLQKLIAKKNIVILTAKNPKKFHFQVEAYKDGGSRDLSAIWPSTF